MEPHRNRWMPFLLCLALWGATQSSPGQEECTTAVISGRATQDGRPLLWKNRESEDRNNAVAYFEGPRFDALGIINAGNTEFIWMGINSAGFAIENSHSGDLEGFSSGENGILMKYALLNCETVEEFERLLRDTNTPGRGTQANFGVIDSMGGAAIFETGNHSFTKFDANDPVDAPKGYIIRTNFAFTGNGSGGGYTRYDRATELIDKGGSCSLMNHRYILRIVARDLKNDAVDPYPLPFDGGQDGYPPGYVRTVYSINRSATRSCAVFHGVRPGEDPRLSTMWVILGEPVCGFAVPLWVYAGPTPPEMDGPATAPLSDITIRKKTACYSEAPDSEYIDTAALFDRTGGGLFSLSFPIEDYVLAKTESALELWRRDFPDPGTMSTFEYDIVARTTCGFSTGDPPRELIRPPLDFSALQVNNRSLLQTESLHVLTWQPNPLNTSIPVFRIFEVTGSGLDLLHEWRGGNFLYLNRRIDPLRDYSYALLAVDESGREGDPACIYPASIDFSTPPVKRTASMTLKQSGRGPEH